MIGAIIGDIVGSRFEFNNTGRMDFDLFTPECDYTDDTICTVAIADAILNGKSYKDSLLEWCRKYPNPKGAYGASFSKWIHSDDPQPYNSFGNGSAMRVSPVAKFFDLDKMLLEAEQTAIVSHNHPEGIKGAVAVAHAIYYLKWMRDLKSLPKAMGKYYEDIAKMKFKRNVFNETCQETVPLSIQIVAASNSFEDAIRRAIAHGGDSDTIGAIVGSMAEAYYGVPSAIKEQALSYLPEDMKIIVNQYYQPEKSVNWSEIFRFYKGEKCNPYPDASLENLFWFYESKFKEFYEDGDFRGDPADRSFTNYLNDIFYERIPEKFGINPQTLSKEYFKD